MSADQSTPSVFLSDPDVTLWHGDVLATLRELPAESVDCVVTSPPYWGLRDYGQEGQLGLEPTPEQYVERMVEVFREVRRVLAAHGTVWLNLGDSYCAQGGGGESRMMELGRPSANAIHAARGKGQLSGRTRPKPSDGTGVTAASVESDYQGSLDTPDGSRSVRGFHEKVGGRATERSADGRGPLKPKDLVGIPWRVAFALQADGWYLRSDIIWAKPNPMPESVTDRPTKAHEYVFLLSKQPRYFFDQEAVREPAEWARWGDQTYSDNGAAEMYGTRIKPRTKAEIEAFRDRSATMGRRQPGNTPDRGGVEHRPAPGGRNIRSVWEIATQPYPEAHFATFPEELARRCIAAGCPEQVCRVCGKARERVVDVSYEKSPVHGAGSVVGRHYETGANNFDGAGMPRLNKVTETTGWTDCEHADYRPGIVLDPFMGSGTVAFVARKLGRHAVGIDLNADYLALAARRLQQQSLFAEAASGL